MGHVGKRSIRSAWWLIVLPALLLSYAGQTALWLQRPAAAENPFFRLAPAWAIVPLVVLATLATIIASQAIITGAFSLTRQATQLGWFPAVRIYQTSSEEYGQIYVPLVNWTMMLLTVGLTLIFRNSSRLAGAYGTAVSTTMLLTTLLLYKVMRDRWNWPVSAAMPLCGLFLTVDTAFFAANLLKIEEGGWIPLTFGAVVFLLMSTWRTGTDAVRQKLEAITESTAEFFERLTKNEIPRVTGTGVFLTRMTDSIPPPIIDHVAEVGALYKNLIALTVSFEQIPRVQVDNRLELERMAENFWHITVHFGFMEIPDLLRALDCGKDEDLPFSLNDALYFGSRDQVIRAAHGGIMGWRMPLFAFMFRNSLRISDLFNLPPRRFLEIGRQVEI
jgi:KUP system potassium uptake protein